LIQQIDQDGIDTLNILKKLKWNYLHNKDIML
jgi:hypothetical protein